MDHHQSAREALNHLLATDTFLRGTLVPTGDVEWSKSWNAAAPSSMTSTKTAAAPVA